MYVLGISAYYHDAAAALLCDGRIVAAAQEERFTRRKHDKSFPAHAIRSCLDRAGITSGRLDHVVFYDKPLQKFDRLIETHLSYAPRGWAGFRRAIPSWLTTNLHLPRIIRRELLSYEGEILFTEHHEAHAASAFFPSPYPEAAVICFDGVGEWTTTSWGRGRGRHIDLQEQIVFPHSLGMLYSAFTQYTGFRVNSGEYKLMGLAPYGKPSYTDLILERLLDLREDGSFRLRMEYFDYCQGLTMTSRRFHDLFGGPPRKPESELTQKEMDIAASAQRVIEEIVLRIGRYVHERTSQKHLLPGGWGGAQLRGQRPPST